MPRNSMVYNNILSIALKWRESPFGNSDYFLDLAIYSVMS